MVSTAALFGAPAMVLGDDPPPVAPSDEIEVLDPRVDSEGKPRAVLTRTAEGIEVDVPPTVLVLRYYYTGDRDFQGPLLPGGPSILVVSHPRTGKRVYVEVTLLPGAPRVHYRHHAVLFEYEDETIMVEFPHLWGPRIVHCEGLPFREKAGRAVEHVGRSMGEAVHHTGIPQVARHVAEGTAEAATTASMRLHDAARLAVAPFVRIGEMLPISRLLSSTPEERAQWERDRAVRRAAAELESQPTSIPTLR